jgi:hypothetical protein
MDFEKTTPIDVSDYEREQLRFFLSGDNLASALNELNPSLAWLPILAELKLTQNDAVLATWVERNFNSIDAVRDVVANIHLFKSDSARILANRLDAQRDKLEPLLVKCWHLIIRHIRNAQRDPLVRGWFEILPRIKRGDLSMDILERLAGLLTPELRVEPRFGWYDKPDRKIEQPTDLLSVKYHVDEGVSESDFLGAWPKDAPIATLDRLVRMLTEALSRVLADAIEVGVESDKGLGVTDIDVPSVAAHAQNAFRDGFLPIVRIAADLWSQLAKKSGPKAKAIFAIWKSSDFRLIHRLALFAAADPVVPPQQASDLLLQLPQGELFLTNSRVEVHRLLRARWTEFTEQKRQRIEDRIIKGPPTDWFRPGADLSNAIDSSRFELLLDFKRSKLPLGKEALKLLNEIRKRHPSWRDAEPERAGFMIWQGSVRPVADGKQTLKSVSSDHRLQAAMKVAENADFMSGDAWQGLCQEDAMSAFEGIEAAPESDRWHQWAWRPFLWNATKIANVAELNHVAQLLARWPETHEFHEVAPAASAWMEQVSDRLKAPVLWALWDLIERRAPRREEVLHNDPFTTALNDASGHLASVLLKRTPRPKGQRELGKQLERRYQTLTGGHDTFSTLARVRFSAAIAFLFERAPAWATAHLIPSYDWSSPDAAAMWSARKYSNHIGSSHLFKLTKAPFLEMFVRAETAEEDLRAFADWLAFILVVNKAGKADYDLSAMEVRSVLRRARPSTLSSFAHRLAIEMESAKPGEKIKVWKELIRPIFEGAWPLDAELQSSSTTFKLIQILLATGPAFREAADVIVPFIRAEDPRGHTSIFSIGQAKQELYSAAPDKMLGLLTAAAGDAPERSLFGLNTALQKLEAIAPQLVQTKAFQRLSLQATPY